MAMITVPLFWYIKGPDTQPLGVEVDGRKYVRFTCQGHRGAERQLGNLAIKITPSGVKDFTWSWMGDILVSQHVLDLFAKHRVTGFETRSAEVIYPDSAKVQPPELFDLVVTGWGRLAAPEAGMKIVKSCPDCGDKTYTIADRSRLIDSDAWDGSDLFVVWPLPRFRFASDRLANLLRQEKVSGLKLIPASEIPNRPEATVSPGRLASHMPAERARELSERFGID
jgi:hypothetical protein